MTFAPRTLYETSTRDDCSCGCDALTVELDPRRHGYRHRQWAKGIRLAKTVAPEATDGVLLVPTNGPLNQRKLAFRMARLTQREHHWDFPTAPYPTRVPPEEAPEVFLYLKDRRAVGYLVVKRSPAWIPADPGEPVRYVDRCLWPRGTEAEFREEHIRCVGEVFICGDFRRIGVGTALVHAVLEAYEIKEGELAFGGPFTEAGLALARRFAVDGLVRVGA